MNTTLRQILKNSTTRIMVIIFGCMLAITSYFILSSYYHQLNLYEQGELSKLKSIATTLALQIDGESHKVMYNNYPEKNGIKTNEEDPIYDQIRDQLVAAKEANNLETTIYTMVYDADKGKVCFAVATSEEPFFKHVYDSYKQTLIDNYDIGGTIAPYEDEFDTWLSAFAPIKDYRGNTVAVVQVDEIFDDFITRVQKAIMITTAISLGVAIIIAFFLLKSIRTILLKEEAMTREIVESKKVIEEKNKDITDSIMYAQKIQEAILPSRDRIRKAFPDSFLIFLPRDIVSGDFYWFTETENRLLIAAVDCTGHGVPGAFMSMIGNILLNEIVIHSKITEPAEILNELAKGIEQALKQSREDVESKDGMDLALCSFDKNHQTVEYSGAFRPFVHIRRGEIMEIKGDKFPIGGGFYDKALFANHTVKLEPGDQIYIFSDGYPDQFGGEKGKKFMTKRFKDMLVENKDKPMPEIGEELHQRLVEWQGELEQVDDILVIGIRVPA